MPPVCGYELLRSVVKLFDRLVENSCVGVKVREWAAGEPTGLAAIIIGAVSDPMSVNTCKNSN